MYAMRRANGDWFALEVKGEPRVPVFRSATEAWRYHAKNSELTLFRPAPLDGGALAELSTADGGQPAGFWLVDEDDVSFDLRRGRLLRFAQLATLEGAAWSPQGSGRAVDPRNAPGGLASAGA